MLVIEVIEDEGLPDARPVTKLYTFFNSWSPRGSPAANANSRRTGETRFGILFEICSMNAAAVASLDVNKFWLAGLVPCAANLVETSKIADSFRMPLSFQSTQPPSPIQKRPLQMVRIHHGSQATQTKMTSWKRDQVRKLFHVCIAAWRRKTGSGTVLGMCG